MNKTVVKVLAGTVAAGLIVMFFIVVYIKLLA
jgi:hypothetical protein